MADYQTALDKLGDSAIGRCIRALMATQELAGLGRMAALPIAGKQQRPVSPAARPARSPLESGIDCPVLPIPSRARYLRALRRNGYHQLIRAKG